MARSNPNKKKRRAAKATAQIEVFPGNSHADPKAHAEKFPKPLLDAADHPLLDTLLSAFKLL